MDIESVPWSAELRALAGRYGEHTAVSDHDGRLSYASLSARAHALAGRLLSGGLRPGEAVATLLPNGLRAVWGSLGVILAGGAETPLDFRLTADEIVGCARVAGFRVVVTGHERLDSLRALGLSPIAVEAVDAADPGTTLDPVPGGARGRIQFTSGTTGRPRAAVYSHARRWLGNQVLKGSLPFIPGPGARILLMTPFSHGASLLCGAYRDLGGEVVLHDGVDPPRVRALLEAGGVDALFAPPTVLAKLSAALGDARFSGVRCVFTGTAPLPKALYARACAMFGPVVRVTYGKAECTNPVTVLSPAETHAHYTEDPPALGACVGWPGAGVEIRVVGPEGEALDVGAEGEVWLRARHMSEGYLEAEGRMSSHAGGWHRTGDLGRLDDRGRLWLTGRLADVIKTGGYRVNPDEIEACLGGLAACRQVSVTSVLSDYWGEVIIAAAEGVTGDWAAEARARVAGLSRHKHPRAHVSVEALPRNAQGKVQRRAVRDLVLAEHVLADGPYPSLSRRPAG